MIIYASAADPMSWLNLMDGISTTTPNSEIPYKLYRGSGNYGNVFSLIGTSSDYGGSTPGLTIDTQNTNELFVSTGLSNTWIYNFNSSGWIASGDSRKLYKFLNSDGRLLYSIGFSSGSNVFLSDGSDNHFRFYTYNDAGIIINTYDTGVKIPFVQQGGEISFDFAFRLHIKIDPLDHTKSFAKFYRDSLLTGSVSGEVLHVSPNYSLKTFKLRDNVTGKNISSFPARFDASYLVVSNTANFTLKAFPLKPSALTGNNQFSGVVSSISPWLQDKNYLVSPNEVNTKVESYLTRPSGVNGSQGLNLIEGLHKIIKIDNYGMTRYVQDGGTSVNMKITTSNDVTTITPETSFSTTANQDDNYYLGRFLSSGVVNENTSSLINIKNTIELVGS